MATNVTTHVSFVGIRAQEQFAIRPGIEWRRCASLFADVVTIQIVTSAAQSSRPISSQPVLLRTRLTAQTVVPYAERLQFSKLVYNHIR